MKPITYFYALVAIALISISLYIPSSIFLKNQTQKKIRLHYNNKISQASIEFEAVENSYTLVSDSIFQNVIDKEEIISLVKQANAANDAGKNILRQRLYNKLLPLYKNLNNQNIQHLHFHLKNSVSFLRFHRPEQFGDSLAGERYSIDKVNRTYKSEYGFEEGRDFNGFRHVYPLIYKNKFAGTVEISYSFNAIRDQQMKLSPASYDCIMRKNIISAKDWDSETGKYKVSALSKKYLQDNSGLAKSYQSSFTQEEIQTINEQIASTVEKKLISERDFLIHTKLNGKDLLVVFLPILNIENKQVAYFLSYTYDKTIPIIKETNKLELYTAGFTSLLLAIFFVLYILSQKRAAKAIELLATTDPLTKIANRNKLNMILEKSINLSQRYKQSLSVIFFDIDNFKNINAIHGRDAGDTVLTGITHIVSKQLRTSDIFARWGGAKFIIVLPETEQDNAHMLAERFRKHIEDYKFLPNTHVTCSFGVTQLKEDDSEASLLKRVDHALHTAKEHGRNKVVELA